jgi:Flp pilus assembly protein TadG
MMNLIQEIKHDETGSELVETALSIPILFAVIFGIIYFSFALYADHFVANVAKEAARYAAVRGSTWSGASCQSSSTFDCTATGSDITNFVTAQMPPGLSSTKLSVSASWPGTTNTGATCDTLNGNNSPNCQVIIQVSYQFTFPFPFVNQGVLPFSSNAAMTIVE